jgi:glycosyltransferase involved in cell wall biosynthesis
MSEGAGATARRVDPTGDASRPLVSVILPTCDRPTRVATALESFLAPDYDHLEVVIVDDASTVPAETAVASALEDARVKIIRLPRRTGAAGARNAGLVAASADLIAFIDDDDRWHPHKVRRQVEAFLRRPELGLVTCDYFIVNEDAAGSPTVYRGPAAFTAAQVLWMNFPGGFSFVMAQRSALGDELRLDETFPSVEDWDLWLRCAQMAPVEVIREPLCHHIVHGGLSRPTSERAGIEQFLRKHTDSMSPTCRAYIGGHLRMYKGTGWRKRASVARAMATPSARASALLVLEQVLRVAARRRRDPGLVARTIATIVGPDGLAVGTRRQSTEPRST